MGAVNVLYERFEKNLQAVNGNSWLADKADAAGIIATAYQEAGIDSVCIAESPLLEEIGLAKALADAGMKVYTDHIRLHAETAKGGVLEAQCAIADLGSIVQLGDDIDNRIVATMPEYCIGVVKLSEMVDDYDAMFDKLCSLEPLPAFVGFVTGPSRTADIECVSTVGVHGPLKLSVVVINDV
ncbi:MAG: lactate utilization protein C [Lachnospiraceae bacterium]|jgi:L-lactate dehydrogenase complex protein LldG|nr:lactate utilization protein C [Lachnospiraceae bacterium]